ncbi:MAG TPA: DUF4908 domain-containing protein [Caulobacteraceae bacterium]|nr:DUF4908 domain-containing protein [Caulobacteraceae bacterium]
MALAGGVAAALIAGGVAHAGPFNLGDELFGHRPAKPPPVGLYRDSDDGDPPFILDRSSPALMLLRFEDSQEIWLLTPHPASRGDMIYKNDVGEPMLRATRLGGLTVFTPARPDGMPAAFVADAAPMRLPATPNSTAFLLRMTVATTRTSRALQRGIVFDYHDVTADVLPVVVDAANVTAEAVVVLAKRAEGRHALARLVRVSFSPGRRPSATMANGVLEIVVSGKGNSLVAIIAGRPSSRRIELALEQ